jgi:hypothetical protein
MNTSCSICLEAINENDECTLNCKHQFCKKCIDEWLQKNKKTCPNCRAPIQSYYNNDINYRLLYINPDETDQRNENILLRNQLHIYQIANKKLLKFGYIALSIIGYLSYTYLSQYLDSQSLEKSLQNNIIECNHNNTIISNLLTDQSIKILMINNNDARQCDISEYTYTQCFHGFI